MERERLQRADQPSVAERPLAHGLEELRTTLGDLARVALASSSEVMKLTGAPSGLKIRVAVDISSSKTKAFVYANPTIKL